MKKLKYLLWVALLVSGSWNLNATSSNTVSEIKVQLETKTLSTPYKNILGKNAKEEINAFLQEQQSEINTAAFFIKIKYSKGLETIQYVEKRVGENFYYESSFYAPEYEVTVLDSNQVSVFEGEYGKEKVITTFGKEDEFKSSSELSTAWRKAKRTFYKTEEEKYNNVITFLEDFEKKVLPDYIVAPKEERQEETSVEIDAPEPIDSSLVDPIEIVIDEPVEEVVVNQDTVVSIQDTVVNNQEIAKIDSPVIEQKADSVQIEITQVDTSTHTPIVTSKGSDSLIIAPIAIIDQRNLRDHNKIISVGMGLGNLRGYQLAQPLIGGSLDRYSFDDLLGVDWFFAGGWIGYGKYKFDYDGFYITPFDVTEVSFISRYGVSVTRILQDKGIASKLTQNFDVYALIQFGYSIVVADDFILGVDTSGARGGLAIGGRYEWKNFGVFTELGKTETGYAKAGFFLKL